MIHFITSSTNKFEEAKKIIPELEHLSLGLDEIQEMDSKKVIENKIKEAFKLHPGPFIVEDSGIRFFALNGFPGPLAKWFLKSLGVQKIYDLLHKSGEDDKAEATCVLGYAKTPEDILYFEGMVWGTIVAPKGENGFGHDPIFMPEGADKTFAEMNVDEKNQHSSRSKAFGLLKKYLEASVL
ncbi:MAG: non-canonical purine NTP pyrophosphatase [Candidatus Paceibacterota bacterium]